VGLVRERKGSGTNAVKTRDRVVETGEAVGKSGRSGRGKEGILQQKSVVTVEVHDDLEGDVGVSWLPVPPPPFSSIEFGVTPIILSLAAAREEFSKTFERAEEREVSEETVRWRVAGRSQGDITIHRWQNFLRIEPSLDPRGAVPALFLNLIQVNAHREGCWRFLQRGRHPFRTPPSQRRLPHGEKVTVL